jgi:hypothetical protein
MLIVKDNFAPCVCTRFTLLLTHQPLLSSCVVCYAYLTACCVVLTIGVRLLCPMPTIALQLCCVNKWIPAVVSYANHCSPAVLCHDAVLCPILTSAVLLRPVPSCCVLSYVHYCFIVVSHANLLPLLKVLNAQLAAQHPLCLSPYS